MIVTLAWKEYREHRSIWLTMVVLTVAMALGLAPLISTTPGSSLADTTAIIVLGMAAAYGVVCGGMMFAGERENGTLVFLDIFLGRRGLLWLGKAGLGVFLALSEGLAVAAVLLLLKQGPPRWLPVIIGRGGPHGLTNPHSLVPPASLGSWWFLAVPAVTVEAYAWGLLGSALSARVLAGAGLAALMATPLWLITIFAPPPVFLGVRLVAVVIVLAVSLAVFLDQSRETSPAPVRRPPDPVEERFPGWQGSEKFDIERRLARRREPEPAAPVLVPEVVPGPERVVRRAPRPSPARTPGQALRWLTARQAGVVFWLLAGAALLVGAFVPFHGQVLWPVATLLVGVACGTAAFAPEQREQSYQFLAAQHFPLKTVWNVKIAFWLTAAALLAGILAGGGGLILLAKALAALRREPIAGGQPPAPVGGFDFGTLPQVMGPVAFFTVWLAYGFAAAQVFVLFCRKNILAVLLGALVGAGLLALWLPSILCGGLGGWQLWLAPVVLLVASRCLVRAWAGGRIKERRPLAAAAGFGAVIFVWAAVFAGFRAWQIPDVAEPLDREAFRASVPTARANPAGQKIQEAIADFNQRGAAGVVWPARLADVARLPAGVVANPFAHSQTLVRRDLHACRGMADALRDRAREQGTPPGAAWNDLAQVLALSRTWRNKATLDNYLAGVDMEADALHGLDQWLAQGKPSPALLRRVLDDLNRHAAETPPPLDCLKTECHRAGSILDFPAGWTLTSAPGVARPVADHRLTGLIAISYEAPWERERKERLWRLVWAGLLRGIAAPDGSPPGATAELAACKETTRQILAGWQPPEEGPGASMTVGRLGRLLDDSWLSDRRLFTPVGALRSAATRARWRVDSRRLAVALALYQMRHGRPAARLEDLVPNELPRLPADPYTGGPFHYRVSRGENVFVVDALDNFRLPRGPHRIPVRPGQGVLWSTGPDRVDHGGHSHGGRLPDEDPEWLRQGFDLVTVVPVWP